MKALKRAGKAAKTFASIVLAGSLVGIGLVGCSGEAMGNASGRDDEIVLTVSKCQTKELPQELLDEMTNRHPNLLRVRYVFEQQLLRADRHRARAARYPRYPDQHAQSGSDRGFGA